MGMEQYQDNVVKSIHLHEGFQSSHKVVPIIEPVSQRRWDGDGHELAMGMEMEMRG